MQICLIGNHMFTIMDVDENSFDLAKKAEMDANNPKVQEWEKLMGTFQQALPWANHGEIWTMTEKIFQLGARCINAVSFLLSYIAVHL